MPLRSLADLHLDDLIRDATFTPSPNAWEDQVLYFLLVDRFSDGNEKGYRDLNGNFVADVHSPRAVDSAHAPLAQERSQFVFAI